jgi:hypothetical protein
MIEQILELFGIKSYTCELMVKGATVQANVTTNRGKKYILLVDTFGGLATLFNGGRSKRQRGTIYFEVVPHPKFSYVKGHSNEPKPLGSVKF